MNVKHINNKQIITSQTLFCLIALTFIITWALLIRIDTYFLWQATPQKFLLQNGEPMLSTLDGYYYLNTAKEIVTGKYSATDTMRAYPDNVSRAETPSLLPTLLTILHKTTGISLNWLGAILPVFLGLFISAPLYCLSKNFGGRIMGIGAVAIGTLSFYYAQRSSLARLDTDCLNLTLALTCAYFFYMFGKLSSYKRYLHLTFGFFFYAVYLWWWDMSPGAASILALSPLLVALIIHYRPSTKKEHFFYILIIGTVIFVLLTNHHLFSKLYNSIIGQINYISKVDTGAFPNIGFSIAEQKNISWHNIDRLTVNSWPILAIAFSGLCLLIYKRKFDVLYLLPITLVGTLAIFFANRFAIFLTPIVAFGFGYFFHFLANTLNYKKTGLVLLASCIVFLGWRSHSLGSGHSSAFSSSVYRGMESIKTLTETNAIIWSWWDEGHPLIYFGERATISDGYLHGGELSYLNALPFVTTNERFAANFIKFYVKHGMKGVHHFLRSTGRSSADGYALLQRILGASLSEASDTITSTKLNGGPSNSSNSTNDWLEFFFPATESSRPVYLFLDNHLASRIRWLFWYGTWNIDKHQGIETLRTIQIDQVHFDKNNNPFSDLFKLDLEKGLLFIPRILEHPLQLQEIITTTSNSSNSRQYAGDGDYNKSEPPLIAGIKRSNGSDEKHTNKGNYFLELFPEKNILKLQDVRKQNCMINELYWRQKQSEFFTLIEATDDYQLWRVENDKM